MNVLIKCDYCFDEDFEHEALHTKEGYTLCRECKHGYSPRAQDGIYHYRDVCRCMLCKLERGGNRWSRG